MRLQFPRATGAASVGEGRGASEIQIGAEQGARMWRARANAPKPPIREAFRVDYGVMMGGMQTRGVVVARMGMGMDVDVDVDVDMKTASAAWVEVATKPGGGTERVLRTTDT